MLNQMPYSCSHSRVCRAVALTCLGMALLAGVADGQSSSSESSQLLVFVNGTRLGEAQSTVQRTDEGWTITSTGRLSPPLDLVTRHMSIRYAPDWTPLGLEIDALSRGAPLAINTTVTGSTAASDVTQLGQTIQKSDPITKGALLLPNMFFASFEALALRLSALTEESARFTAYIAPQAEIQIAVRRLDAEIIETQQRALQARRFAVTFMNPGKPLESEVWIDENGRLLRFGVVTQGLAVIREDVSSVTARRQNITRAGDETLRIPANGFNLVGTLSKPSGSPDAKGRYPAVIMVAGSGPTDRDETVGGIPIFGQVAGMLADAGFLVVRYDKRGVGQSGGRSESATLTDYADDVMAVRRFLSERKDVDDRRIAIFGHGEGTAVALIAASRDKHIASVILAGGASGPGADLVLEQQQAVLAASTLSEEEKAARIALQRRVQAAVLGTGEWKDVPDDVRRQADTPWFRSFLAFDPARLISEVRQPILILHGDRDRQVPPEHADKLGELARARKKVPAERVKVVKLPGANHLLAPEESGNIRENASLVGRSVSADAGAAVVEFLRQWMPERK
jgi:pimeloyl-ACP methyl ester carboxylesterase